jgi:hypothetical protein
MKLTKNQIKKLTANIKLSGKGAPPINQIDQ